MEKAVEDEEALIARSRSAFNRKDYIEAEICLERRLEIHISSGDAIATSRTLYLLCVFAIKWCDRDMALPRFERMLSVGNGFFSDHILVQSARKALKQKRFTEALRYLDRLAVCIKLEENERTEA